ncbi:hypothetical protein F5Y15DRAFT_382951 [Xylariaceae sp. FL0016]|nr:hypothetical protein F5Y15DRAFT_382951 [Xylariaceae sp. FL0016]
MAVWSRHTLSSAVLFFSLPHVCPSTQPALCTRHAVHTSVTAYGHFAGQIVGSCSANALKHRQKPHHHFLSLGRFSLSSIGLLSHSGPHSRTDSYLCASWWLSL